MLETLDDGINVTRILKRSSAIKMKRFLRFLERRILPSQEITKENVIHLLYRTHTHTKTHAYAQKPPRFIVENDDDDDDDEAFFIFIIPGIIYSREQ